MFFKPKKEKISSSSKIEDADILYFGESNTETRKEIVKELGNKDFKTRIIEYDDLEIDEEEFQIELDIDDEINAEEVENEIKEDYLAYSSEDTEIVEDKDKLVVQGRGMKAEIEGVNVRNLEEEKNVIWRPKGFLEDWEELDDVIEYGLLKQESENLNFNQEPLNTPVFNDKEYCKEILGSHGIPTPKTYDTLEEVNENKTVVKSNNGSQGEGFGIIGSDEEIEELDEDMIYEEFLDHYSEDSVDRRMFIVGDKFVAMGDRELKGSKIDAKNINNGGHYSEPDFVSEEEIETGGKIVDIFGEGIYAIDYVRHDDGSLDVLEVNDTPGTQLNNSLDYGGDIFEEVAEYVSNPEEYLGDDSESLQIAEELAEDVENPQILENPYEETLEYAGNSSTGTQMTAEVESSSQKAPTSV